MPKVLNVEYGLRIRQSVLLQVIVNSGAGSPKVRYPARGADPGARHDQDVVGLGEIGGDGGQIVVAVGDAASNMAIMVFSSGVKFQETSYRTEWNHICEQKIDIGERLQDEEFADEYSTNIRRGRGFNLIFNFLRKLHFLLNL